MTTLRRRCFKWQVSLDGRTRIVLLAFILVAVQPLLIGELSVLLSPHRHATVVGIMVGFVILAAILAMLLAALVRRRRWAWRVLTLLFGAGVILDMFKLNDVVAFIIDLIAFALLMSPSMRRYVHRTDASARLERPVGDGPCAG